MSGWRAAALRHLLGRLHIGDDIVAHLSTFQRLGETLEIAPPGEMLPVGARTLFRAIRTRAAVQIRPDWLWAHWLEAQLDPTGPAFTPRGHLPAMQNVTARNWTMVGNPDSPWEAIVDPTGLVTPWFDAWSLDWWVQARGEWLLPTRVPVTQGLLGSAPVVVTRMPVLDGAVEHRAYGVDDDEELVAVEVANLTSEPLQLAFSVRPYNPEGLAVVEHIAVEGRQITVDGRPGVQLEGVPLGVVTGCFVAGDSSNAARAGAWVEPSGVTVSDHAGLASVAVLLDLPAGATVRAAMPLAGSSLRRRRVAVQRRSATAPLVSLPAASDVAKQWDGRLQRGLRLQLPDQRLQAAVDANRAYMLLLHDPGDITAGPFTYHRFWFRDAAYQIAALDRYGFSTEAADVLRTYPSRQRVDGFFYSQWHEWDANGAAIWAIAEHHRLVGDDALLAELAPSVDRGARWISRMCARNADKGSAVRGLLPAGVSAEHLGPFDYYYWDDLWAWRGLRDAAAVARWRGDAGAAAAADSAAERLRAALLASIHRVMGPLGVRAIPAGPTRGIDAGMIGSLAACYPLGLLEPDDPLIAGTADVIRQHLCLGEGFYQGISHTGLGTYLTLQLAFVEVQGGDLRGWRRLRWLLDAATPTFTWPEAIHPQLPGGCMGDGHHGWMAADLLNFVRMVLLRETPAGLALLSVLPPEWRGQRVTVTAAPTHHGLFSYELDWDGDRPVLRWQADRDGVVVTAPGLDPTWRAGERAGEARLPPVSDAAGAGARA